MLSKIIVSSYKVLIELSLWLTMITSIGVGWSQVSKDGGNGFLGAIAGLSAWLVMAVIIFGAFLVLSDIQQAVRNIEESIKE